ncbi:hypothetical protein I203_104763 [Kwoniella mangroviensis CBS 8507]|uniref:uncharacterized protein n=1 Tax=Kwoniella mangroviensis CBS 8507 TaxID=1296122 RepID=UPI00306DD663
MSHPQEATEDDLAPTETQGYKVGQSKTVAELAALDQEDESLQRWKASLGLAASAGAGGNKKVVLKTLFLSSPTLSKDISIDLTQPAADLAKLKKEPWCRILRWYHLYRRKRDSVRIAILTSRKEPAPYTKVFASEESPSGMLARSGTYSVKSRVTDDDNNIWLDFEWSFKLAKEW